MYRTVYGMKLKISSNGPVSQASASAFYGDRPVSPDGSQMSSANGATEKPRIKVKPSKDANPAAVHPDSSNRIRLHKQRHIGLSYDSEASDREEDPWVEEQFILRMVPGDDCNYLRKAIEKKEIGQGTDVSITFLGK